MQWRINRNRTVMFYLACIVVLAFLPIFFGRFYAIGDMRDVYIPIELFFQRGEREGFLPAWNADMAWGFPVIAAAQIGFFYPPLLIARFFPIQLYLPIILLTHLFFLAYGTYLFFKQLNLSNISSFFGAIVFSLSGFLWQHLTHLNIFLAIAWFPWQLLLAHIIIPKKSSLPNVILFALSLGIPFLIGQVQIPFFIALISVLYAAYRILEEKSSINISSYIWKFILIGICVAGLSAAQLLPTYELSKYSSRADSSGFSVERANQHSYPVYHLPTLLFPRFYGSDSTYWGKRLEIEYGFYIGTIPLLLAAVFLWRRKKGEHAFFFRLLIISFLLSLGSLSPFRLIGLEPSLWIFSAPARWLLFATFSASLFAAQGLEHLETLISKKLLTRIIKYGSTLLIVLNIGLFSLLTEWYVPLIEKILPEKKEFALTKLDSMVTSATHSTLSFASWATYLPILAVLAFYFFHGHKNIKKYVLIISIFELLLLSPSLIPTVSWSNILEPPTTVSLLSLEVRNSGARIYSVRDGGDTGAYFTDPDSRADANVRELQRNLLLPLAHAQYGVAGIEWPASLDLQKASKLLDNLHEDGDYGITNETLADELNIGAILIPQYLDDNSDSAATSNGVNIYTRNPKPRYGFKPANTDTEIPLIFEQQNNGSVTLQKKEEVSGDIIIRDTWYPGWVATINGAKTTIKETPEGFREIAAPEGSAQISLEYAPKVLVIGVWISAVTFLLCCVMMIAVRKTA